MKKLIALLMAFLPGVSKAAETKLGSEGDLIRQMLFSSQSLKEQVAQSHLDGTPGPFQSIADASKLVDAGKREEAIALLRGILDTPKLQTRIQLWVWSALRELGQTPDPKMAYEVLGAIIEFPSGGGYDTLAGYVDGSARYLNFSGDAIFWDAEDATIKAKCQALIDSTIPASSRAKPRTSLSLPKGTPQVTMLTRSGPFVIVSPPDSVIGPGAALMMELMKRAKEKKDEPQGHSQRPGRDPAWLTRNVDLGKETMQREPDAIVRFRLDSLTLEGKRKTVSSGYRPVYDIRPDYWTSTHHEFTPATELSTGEKATAKVWFVTPEVYPKTLWVGRVLRVAEGSRQVGTATIQSVLNPVLRKM